MIKHKQDLPFIPTKPYARFVEFVENCKTDRYIGICYGKPGVGKTLSAQTYSQWALMDEYQSSLEDLTLEEHERYIPCQAVFYTAPVANTPKTLQQGLRTRIYQFGQLQLRLQKQGDSSARRAFPEKYCPLVIVDEADRLSIQSFEQLRDFYDQYGFGLVLLGMPGLEKRLARYPQLYSRVGFLHEFKPLSKEETRFIFEKYWDALGLRFDKETFTDVEALNAAIRITQGNFRLMNRLFSQVSRLMEINRADRITLELIEAARDCLVIGST